MFKENMEQLERREDFVLQILRVQESAINNGAFATSNLASSKMYSELNDTLDPRHKVPMMSLKGDQFTVDAISEPSTDRLQRDSLQQYDQPDFKKQDTF